MRFPITFPAHHSRAQGILCVLYSVLIWSGWMIVSSYSVRGSLTSYDITAIRFGVSGIFWLPVLIRKGLSIGPYKRWGSLWLALLMGAPFNFITVFGMKFAPASHAAGIINTTMLTVTTILSIFLLNEKTTKLRILGIAISIAGIGCMLFARPIAPGSDAFTGHLFFLIGGVIWAFYVVSMRAWRVEPVHAAAAVCSLSLVIYLPIYLLFLPVHIGMHNLGEVAGQALYQGILNSVFALLLFNRAIGILGASTASAFLPLIPAIATLLAIPALGEFPTWVEVAGIAFAGVGVLLATGIISVRPVACTAPIDGAAAGN
jgi:drug/metabolite transporter (DMT)-like permease